MNLLELTGVRKSYGPALALAGVDLQVREGSRTAIVGASGCGKTTLLRMVAGFESPDDGCVTMRGRRLADRSAMVPAHLRDIGLVAQEGALFPHLSVADNVGFGLARDVPRRRDRIAELMAMVALDTALLERRPHELSGGQQQRVALARALARRPKLMLLDEPFSSLDTGLRAATRKAVAQLLTAAGITSILVTHDQAEALAFADQLAVMHRGRFVQVGPPAEVYGRPVDAATACFLGEALLLPARLEGGWAECDFGRIPVDDGRCRADAQILLRPEQLVVTDAAATALQEPAAAPACEATVLEAEFGGSAYELVVELGRGPALRRWTIRCPSTFVPAVGRKVRIAVRGAAHAFPA
jgi:iron(III) transport system ATP-binding protein